MHQMARDYLKNIYTCFKKNENIFFKNNFTNTCIKSMI